MYVWSLHLQATCQQTVHSAPLTQKEIKVDIHKVLNYSEAWQTVWEMCHKRITWGLVNSRGRLSLSAYTNTVPSKDHAIVGPWVAVSFNHFLTITEADFLLWSFQRCVENKMVTILPVPVCWYQKQQPVYRKGKSNISIKWNIMANLHNTGTCTKQASLFGLFALARISIIPRSFIHCQAKQAAKYTNSTL